MAGKKVQKSIIITILITAVFFTMFAGCISGTDTLTIVVEDPDRVEDVRSEAAVFTNETGIPCTIIREEGDTLPTGTDLIITDLQNLQELAADGSLLPLNQVLKENATINLTSFEWPVLTIFGEYPKGSGEIYALPYAPDALGIGWKTGLYTNTSEREAFNRTYGYELTSPVTWEEIGDMAEFFTRPEEGLYGIALPGQNSEDYSSVTAGIYGSYGVKRGVSSPDNGENSTPDQAAIYSLLNSVSNSSMPDSREITANDAAAALADGNVSMAITWFSLFPRINERIDDKSKVMFLPLPGAWNNEGIYSRNIAVGGDIIGIAKDSVRKEQALAFLTWAFSEPVQMNAEEFNRFPGISSVLDSSIWRTEVSYHPIFPESLRMGIIS